MVRVRRSIGGFLGMTCRTDFVSIAEAGESLLENPADFDVAGHSWAACKPRSRHIFPRKVYMAWI